MDREQLLKQAPKLLSVLGAILGLIGVAIVLAGRLKPSRSRTGSGITVSSSGGPAVQPALDVDMPIRPPRHFTEDLVIPGMTETGADVERQDERSGRSREGV